MSEPKLIQKNFRATQKELDMLAWLAADSGIQSESAYLRNLINLKYKEEQGFAEYLKHKENHKK